MTFEVSELLIHKQITLFGSWVTSLRHMEELLEHLVRWDLHPDRIVTHRLPTPAGRRGLPHRRSGRGRARSASCSTRQRTGVGSDIRPSNMLKARL